MSHKIKPCGGVALFIFDWVYGFCSFGSIHFDLACAVNHDIIALKIYPEEVRHDPHYHQPVRS
jgi:hypothetical protein